MVNPHANNSQANISEAPIFFIKQESCRKDVEHAFGILQSRFAIISRPVRLWNKEELYDIMTACIIMYNMIVEDELDVNEPITDAREIPQSNVEMVTDEKYAI